MAYDPNTPVGAPPDNSGNWVWNPLYGTWVSNAPSALGTATPEVLAAQAKNEGSFADYAKQFYDASQTGPKPYQGKNANAGAVAPPFAIPDTTGGRVTTLGQLAGGGGAATPPGAPGPRNTGGAATPGSTTGGNMTPPGTTPGSPNPNVAMSDFINPMTDYMNQMGLKDLQSSYGAAGDFLSGPAMRGITDYGQKMALGQAWQPAFQDYITNQQQQYNMARDDQTIPFDQQLKLAQLGMSGNQGASSLAATLAALLSGNTTAIGQAGAGGAIGGSNAINSAISQWIQQMLSQNTLNKVFPQTTGQ
jgi:hypothetical protein